jgi:hypothetical protein
MATHWGISMQKLSTHKPWRSTAIAVLTAAAALALVAAPAQAKRIGHVAPVGTGSCTNCWSFSLRTAASSPSYKVPGGHWKITSWRVRGDIASAAEAHLLVVRPSTTHGRFRIVEKSSYGQVSPGGVSKFASSIPVRGGDHLGLSGGGALPVSYSSPSVKDDAASALPCGMPALGVAFGAGAACPVSVIDQARVNVAATLERRG